MIMKKLFFLTFSLLLMSIASFALTPITGTTSTCIGYTSTLHDTTAGGTWSSSNTAVATVGLTTGIVTGIATGTATITYTYLSSSVTTTFTVAGTMPGPITGITTICVGSTSALSDATPGGIWSSSYTYAATIGGSTGVVTGMHADSTTISYTIGGCSATTIVRVKSAPAVMLVGDTTVCVGSTIALTDSFGSTGGIWTSSSTAIATVSGGIVTGVSAGVVIISYSITGTCGTTVVTKSITVSTTTSTGTIFGATSVNIGAVTTLYDGVPGGTWTSSNPAIASVNPTTGDVTGVSVGGVTITYTASGCGGTAYTTAPMTVTTFNGISGHVLFTGPYHLAGTLKVWLITFNPTTLDLQAIDSVSIYDSAGSSSVYYEFLSAPTDSFRIKAALSDTGTTGYTPTYHTSSFYWYSANVLYHTSGTADINQDINMGYGIITSGPGFIGGNVTTGANKGTGGSGPAVGLRMYVLNSSGAIVQKTTTDATGNYTFSNLPLGTYTIFPEALNYLTTAYTSITLTSTTPSMTAASFIQHTISHTITPNAVLDINNTNHLVSTIFVFPNPSNGKLNLQWEELANEKGNITISDITGRKISTISINMNEGTGISQIDLSGLTNGLYMISIKSASINYNNKIQIQK